MTDQPLSANAPGSPPAAPSPRRRRSSFAELFNPRSFSNATTSSSVPITTSPSASNLPPHRRALSQALGISGGSPTQSSPFTAFANQRRASVSTSSGSGSPQFHNSFGDEPAVIEEEVDDVVRTPVGSPASPTFARRVSFGAQALRDVRNGGNSAGPAGGSRPSSTLYTLSESQENKASGTATTGGKSRGLCSSTTPVQVPTTSQSSAFSITPAHVCQSANSILGEGFNWAEAIRERNKRSPTFSASSNSIAPRSRATSTATAEPPKEIPKSPATPPRMKKPDHLGERMLRGDFMMD